MGNGVDRKIRNREYNRIYRERHPARIKAASAANYRNHPKRRLAAIRKWRLGLINRVPKYGQDGIFDFYEKCPSGFEVDHRIPLNGRTVSGLHVIWNLQYLPTHENRVKANRI